MMMPLIFPEKTTKLKKKALEVKVAKRGSSRYIDGTKFLILAFKSPNIFINTAPVGRIKLRTSFSCPNLMQLLGP